MSGAGTAAMPRLPFCWACSRKLHGNFLRIRNGVLSMKRKLTIAIDAKETTCGECEHYAKETEMSYEMCNIFPNSPPFERACGDRIRLPECLAAEVQS